MSAKQPERPGKHENRLPAAPSAEVEDILSEVSRQISSILPANQRQQVIERVTTIITGEAFKGPIAHPRHLEHYERICPGAADRIIAMAEKEQTSRTGWIDTNLREEHADKKRGMYCGLAAFVFLVGAAVFCGWIGQPVLGGSFLATGVLGAVGVFVNGRLQKPTNGGDDDEEA